MDTGTVVDARPTARADVLRDGDSLYVVSGTTVVSEYSSPPSPDDVSAGSAELSRFSYNALTQTYSRDAGFPVTVHRGSTESITLAKDSTGRLWVTYALVAPDNSSQVYVNHSLASDADWGTPYPVPTPAAAVHHDDISAVVAFQRDKIGVLWSNQLTRKFYLAVHRDGEPDEAWRTEVAYGGGVGGCTGGCANDHLNVKALSSDGSGRLLVAVKTANQRPGQPFVSLLVRDAHAAWSSHPFGAVEDLHTRPMIVLDEEHREVFMFAVSPEVGGSIYYKKSGLDDIVFPPGQGTLLIQNGLDTDISNPTASKQAVDAASGLVILATANRNGVYLHNRLDLAGEPPPPPAAPTDARVSSSAADPESTLELTWSDNSRSEDGFAIERRSGDAPYTEVATVAANATSYADTGLAAGDTYTYRVRAWNSVGFSRYSEPAGATTRPGTVHGYAPTEDAYVDSAAPGTRYGTRALLKSDASPVQESYLKFTVSGLGKSPVTSATLRLYVADNGSVKGGSVAQMSDSSWREDTVTYDTRPALDGPALSSLGPVAVGTWYEFDVTPAVRADGVLSFGLRTPSTDGVQFGSREDPAHAPRLVVTTAPAETTAPQTAIDAGPSGTTASTAASLSFSADEAGASFECRLDDSAFAACTSPKRYTGLAEGPHVAEVRATDPSGNTDETPARRAWTVDTTPPGTLVDADVSPVSGRDAATFSFTADELDATFKCSLDGSAEVACSSPQRYSGLADGAHSFAARATDAVGNTEPTPARFAWTVDTVAPETWLYTGPQQAATIDSATFRFSSSEGGSTFECRLDEAAYEPCRSPRSYSGLAEGSHTFRARATDAAGNVDATPPGRTWVIDISAPDTQPPSVTLTAPADGDVVRGRVVLAADAGDDVGLDHVAFLVGGAVVARDGTPPYKVSWDSTTAPDGQAAITARALDASSNATTTSARTVTVDNTAPQTSIRSGPPDPTSDGSAEFAFSSDDEAATLACSLDGGAYAPCDSPRRYSGLADGAHVFRVRATDRAGNVDATPAARQWTVDSAPPQTTVTSGPSGRVNSRSATLTFTSDEAGATFTCSLDGSGYRECASPQTYTALADGAHTFDVRATDAAGNTDSSAADRAWSVDPVVFSDDFESGDFSRWTQPAPHVAIDGAGAVQTAVVRSGVFAAELSAPSITSYSFLRATLSAPQSDLTVSGDFQITAEGAAGQDVPIFKLYDTAGVRVVYINRRNVTGQIFAVNGSSGPVPTTGQLALGEWAHVTVRAIAAGAAASTVEVSLNGVPIYRTSTASLGIAGIRTIQVGNDKQLPFALFADNIEGRL